VHIEHTLYKIIYQRKVNIYRNLYLTKLFFSRIQNTGISFKRTKLFFFQNSELFFYQKTKLFFSEFKDIFPEIEITHIFPEIEKIYS